VGAYPKNIKFNPVTAVIRDVKLKKDVEMKFKSRKDILFSVIIFGILAFILGLTIIGILRGEMEQSERWTLIPITLVFGFVLWLYFGTNYELCDNEFKYRSGPFNGKISVDRIREIIKGKTVYVGFKPATARKGLLVKYDKYEEIYISPKTNETFIKKVLEMNSAIKITD